MAHTKEAAEYKLTLTGEGVSIKREIAPAAARRILAILFEGEDQTEAGAPESPAVSGARGAAQATPKAFMAGKKPGSGVERIACLAYYLSHHRQVRTFKTTDLTKLNTEASQPKISNASVYTRNAVNTEYLSLAGGARKQITARGEAVVEALPDRERVKEALAAHPLSRRRKARRRRR